MYVVDKGELDCYRKFKKDGEDTHLKVYHSGEAFGELALLYNTPRAVFILLTFFFRQLSSQRPIVFSIRLIERHSII
jgi:CRP-like cAMP-binding protein